MSHLCKKVKEQHSATVGVHDLVNTLETAQETSTAGLVAVRRSATKRLDRDVTLDSAAREVGVAECCTLTTEGTQHNGVVWWRSSTGTDSQEGADDSSPDRQIGKPSKALERTNLTKDDTENRENQKTDDKTETVTVLAIVSDRDLGNSTTVVEDQDSDKEKHLDSLKDVDGVSHASTKNTVKGLSKVANGIAIRVQSQEGEVNIPTG